MSSALLRKQLIRASKQLLCGQNGAMLQRCTVAIPMNDATSVINANNALFRGATRSFGASSSMLREMNDSETALDEVGTPKEMDENDLDMGDRAQNLEQCNFDYAKVKRQLYYEDGTPDILYRR